jgi:D-alanyl-D-alanine carboxypeptidase
MVCALGACARARPEVAAVEPAAPAIAPAAAELLERTYPADGPGAVVLVARGDTVLYRAARGLADVDGRVPLRPEALFRIGSMTKQLTAAGLLTLVEAGRLRLDDPLSRYLPGYPGGATIAVRQLLDHTSGIKSFTTIPGYLGAPFQRDLSTAQLIEVFAHQPRDFEPGTSWAYNNSGYVLVGAIIEAITGRPWHELLRERLLRPLGMSHTGHALDPDLAGRVVRGYSYDGDRVVPARPMSMTQAHAAGGLVSNVDDLLVWNRALHEGKVLGPQSYAAMITPRGPAAEPGVRYGFGLVSSTVRGQPMLRHGGTLPGFKVELVYVPGPDITVVVLENDDAKGTGDDDEALARRLAALALGDPYPPVRAVPVPATVLAAAEGVYRFDGGVTRVLRVVDGQLTARRGHGALAVLTPIASDDFLGVDGFDRLRLERDGQGAIVGLRVFRGGEGQGELGVRTAEPVPATPVTVPLARDLLARLAGTYVGGGEAWEIAVDGDALVARRAGKPHPLRLAATSPTRFDVVDDEATLEFSPDHVTLRERGRTLRLARTTP